MQDEPVEAVRDAEEIATKPMTAWERIRGIAGWSAFGSFFIGRIANFFLQAVEAGGETESGAFTAHYYAIDSTPAIFLCVWALAAWLTATGWLYRTISTSLAVCALGAMAFLGYLIVAG